MDINLLCFSAGNSRLAIGVFEAGQLTQVTRIAHEDRANWEGKIADAWSRIKDADEPAIAGASVIPAILEPLEVAVQKATGQKVLWVGRDLDLPIKVLTANPKETGPDRVLNVAAAYEQMEKACAVVDAGTAITVDFCNDQGEFVGGVIAPGLQMMLDALHEKTAKLPRVEFESPPADELFGRDTTTAVRQGIFLAVRGLAQQAVEQFATHLGHWPDLIATGGDAQVLFQNWELVHAISPDLTLYGIALAFANHGIKEGM